MQVFEQVFADLKHKLAMLKPQSYSGLTFNPTINKHSAGGFLTLQMWKKNYVCDGCRMAVQPASQKHKSIRDTGGGPEHPCWQEGKVGFGHSWNKLKPIDIWHR